MTSTRARSATGRTATRKQPRQPIGTRFSVFTTSQRPRWRRRGPPAVSTVRRGGCRPTFRTTPGPATVTRVSFSEPRVGRTRYRTLFLRSSQTQPRSQTSTRSQRWWRNISMPSGSGRRIYSASRLRFWRVRRHIASIRSYSARGFIKWHRRTL